MDNRYAWNCVHWAMCYNRWQCPLGYILQQMTVSTGLCTTTDDSVHWAMCYNRWLCPLSYVLQQMTVSTGLCATKYNRWQCKVGYVLQQMTVSTGLCATTDDCVYWAMCYNRQLCPLGFVLKTDYCVHWTSYNYRWLCLPAIAALIQSSAVGWAQNANKPTWDCVH